jgi:hypothetical protein
MFHPESLVSVGISKKSKFGSILQACKTVGLQVPGRAVPVSSTHACFHLNTRYGLQANHPTIAANDGINLR